MDRINLGRWGENLAELFLVERGLQIVDKNWRSVNGEIDLVVMEGHTLVFVEVKTRSGDDFGFPELAVNRKKKLALIKLAQQYIQEKQMEEDWRIDVIAIRKNKNKQVEVEWFQNAVRENE